MADTTTDFYQHKTDAELLFFVEHPDLYQPDLVAAARRELRRRGVAPTEAPAGSTPYLPAPEAPADGGLRTGPLLLVLAVLLVSGAIFYFVRHKSQPAAVAAAPAKPKPRPHLTEVPTSAIPTYDVAGLVAQQVAQVPAAERTAAVKEQNGEAMRQYRELVKRFWTAETQTEYLTNQAHSGKPNPMFTEQALVVREAWSNWNRAAVYNFKLGPIMGGHFDRMKSVASSQQHILDRLPDLLPKQAFLRDKEIVAREAEVQDWMRTLRPTSPVTGKPYEATVLSYSVE